MGLDVAERAELACRIDHSAGLYMQALREVQEELRTLKAMASTAAVSASAQMRQHRRSGALALLRPCRCALQAAHAWCVCRILLLSLCAKKLSDAYEEVARYSERLWGKAPGESGSFGDEDAAKASSSDAVNCTPAELLRRHSDVVILQRREPALALLRDSAQRRYELEMRSTHVASKEGRRRHIASLLKGEGRGNAGAAQYGLPSADHQLYYEPESTVRCHELARLLLGNFSSERAIVQRWLSAVERSVAAERSIPAGGGALGVDDAEGEGAAPPADAEEAEMQRQSALRAATKRRGELVLPMFAHLAERLLVAGGLPRPFLPILIHLMGRVLMPLAEPCLLPRALEDFAAEDRQLFAQQRRLRQRTPAQLQVAEYLPVHAATGLLDTTPLTAALEALGATSYAQASVDFAMLVMAAVKAVEAHCSAASEAVVSADILLPVMVIVVIHADLPHGYSLLKHAYNYLDASVARSELGYCLVTYEAALEHVRSTDE